MAAPGRKNTDLRFFKGILGEKLHNTIVDFVQAKKNENLTAEQVYNEFKNKIDIIINELEKCQIARKTGLDQKVLKYARHKTGKNEKAVDQLLIDLQKELLIK